MSGNMNFDPTTVKPENGFEPIPAGKYLATIKVSKMEDKDYGKLLTLTHTIVDGEYEGRKIISNYCYEHTNPDTQRIAQGRISAICAATGKNKEMLDDSSELHDIEHIIKVKVTPESKDKKTGVIYTAKNEITSFYPSGAVASGGATGTIEDESVPDFLR